MKKLFVYAILVAAIATLANFVVYPLFIKSAANSRSMSVENKVVDKIEQIGPGYRGRFPFLSCSTVNSLTDRSHVVCSYDLQFLMAGTNDTTQLRFYYDHGLSGITFNQVATTLDIDEPSDFVVINVFEAIGLAVDSSLKGGEIRDWIVSTRGVEKSGNLRETINTRNCSHRLSKSSLRGTSLFGTSMKRDSYSIVSRC